MEKLLVAVPDEEKIRVRVAELARVSAEEAALVSRLERLREEQSTVERERVTHEHELGRLLDDVAEQQAADEVTRRVIAHSGRCRETLHRFRQSMLERHVQRLERLVTEALQSLLRKKTLVHHVSIDPETFALHVHGGSGAIVPAERLSAGERQLLAVAILWGLAQASGRQLPAIIDTPLGRLDSEHRTCLVRNYFPKASHQVILLSTDEEIDGPYYSEMKEWIGREYLITYDETSHSSRITPGYFPQARIAA
jgi:DNA sulfur modification protein DndD